MNTADGSASEVLEVNFFEGIILPRATPAWSGVMHSMSSMPRHSSHSSASRQFLTPRRFFTNWGVRERPARVDGRASFLAGGINHRKVFKIADYSRAPRRKGRGEVLSRPECQARTPASRRSTTGCSDSGVIGL